MIDGRGERACDERHPWNEGDGAAHQPGEAAIERGELARGDLARGAAGAEEALEGGDVDGSNHRGRRGVAGRRRALRPARLGRVKRVRPRLRGAGRGGAAAGARREEDEQDDSDRTHLHTVPGRRPAGDCSTASSHPADQLHPGTWMSTSSTTAAATVVTSGGREPVISLKICILGAVT